jgi:hypothetical protein
MLEFEKHNKIKPEVLKDESDNTTILQKIRNHTGVKSLIFPSMVVGAMSTKGVETKTVNEDIIKNQQEVSTALGKAHEYSTENIYTGRDKRDNLRFFDDNFILEVASSMKKDDKEVKDLIYYKSKLKSLEGYVLTREESKSISEYNLMINNKMKELNEEDKMAAKEKITKLISSVEKTKTELIKHIQSDEYLEKLAKEMNISKEEAKEPQKIRVENIINLIYEFTSSSEIKKKANDKNVVASYYPSEHSIYLPYDIDLKNEKLRDFFSEIESHEILHGVTKAELEMSEKSKELLKKAFKIKNREEDSYHIEYYSRLQELIVRKQILDDWMEKKGIKKYIERFTEEHYKKLLELQKEDELYPEKSILPQGVDELINHIKPEYFIDVMNELAMIQEKDKTYYLSEFDYNIPEDKA